MTNFGFGTLEVPHFDNIINFAGLWGDLAGLTPAQRQRVISMRLDRSLYRVLLEIVKSQKVEEEISKLFAPLKEDHDAVHLMVSAFVVNVLGHDFDISDWGTIFDVATLNGVLTRFRTQVSHFIHRDEKTIRLRASVMSANLLRYLADDHTIMETLRRLFDVATDNSSIDEEMDQLRISLMRYGSVEPIFSERHDKAHIIVTYFEYIRSTGKTRDNPDYWLQYGIACTIAKHLDKAAVAFENAYERERRRRFPNLVKIDNYFARFLMEKAIHLENSEEAFAVFADGYNKIMKQIFMSDNRHYPFKVGRAFTDIASKHHSRWNDQQKGIFERYCLEIRNKASEWQRRNREGNVDVALLISEINKMLPKIQ